MSAGSKESGRVHGGIDFRRELHLALAPVGVRGRGRGSFACRERRNVGAGKGGIIAILRPSLGRRVPIQAFAKGSSTRKVAISYTKVFPKFTEKY